MSYNYEKKIGKDVNTMAWRKRFVDAIVFLHTSFHEKCPLQSGGLQRLGLLPPDWTLLKELISQPLFSTTKEHERWWRGCEIMDQQFESSRIHGDCWSLTVSRNQGIYMPAYSLPFLSFHSILHPWLWNGNGIQTHGRC